MQIGVTFPQTEIGADPQTIRDYVQAVEAMGYHHVLVYDHVLGVDMGIVNLATDSQGETFSGEAVERNRKRHQALRQRLQKWGTKSAKRHLKKLSGKEARFKRNT